ncbi:fructose-6-phosphate aldolase [Globicatella sanguinis]|uniref:fructose-6-phosphate aldolase n=1 Tax=Globicatella sanguinis TaxID=13076 RepID=UPI002543A08C|nr:fructose-6-phosphate aldolase [Globicatella sanguinis]MDK7630831.1 fructose-6-phosphate aldolase [Globicatella sanguinis]WIK67109.1 fructose-6-phosphate aldolase [Globicatella sanguinis]WKT56514.1 fructose-6-phosphate aldolase [Globicatella sanguinis]
MKLLIDSANISKIEEYLEYLPIEGVTTNPSILKKEGNIDFFDHMKNIRKLIGTNRSLHIQVISDSYNGILEDAFNILEKVDEKAFIKIPVSRNGLMAIKKLKEEQIKITATAVYSSIQGILASEWNVDFIAPYINRMQNLGTNPFEVVSQINGNIINSSSSSKILGASYKNIYQVLESVNSGSEYVTLGTDVLDKLLADVNIEQAVKDFSKDWYAIHNRNSIL